MPFLAGDALRFLVGPDHENLRVTLEPSRRGRMHMQLAEAAAEILLLLGRKRLLAKEDHEVLHERVMDLLELLVAELSTEIGAENLGADGRSQFPDLDRLIAHGPPPSGHRRAATAACSIGLPHSISAIADSPRVCRHVLKLRRADIRLLTYCRVRA